LPGSRARRFFFSIEVSVRVWGYEFGLCSVWGRTGEGDGQMVAAFFFFLLTWFVCHFVDWDFGELILCFTCVQFQHTEKLIYLGGVSGGN
jgi:hypothetical protein